MIKPLLKVMPALSGNIKLACELDNYTQVDDNIFKAISRKGRLYPLSSNMFQSPIDISLLNSNWEYDIMKFYKVYSDIFYANTFQYDKNNYLKVYSLGNIINDRNVDVEFGCKRVSYQKTEKQLCFFAPIYCDNVNDLPDYFEIEIDITNKDLYTTKKIIRVDLGHDKTNHLGQYLKRYFSKVDDNVIYMKPDSLQALYYGIDVKFGGFNQYVDNIISQNFIYETTINGYDANISGGFKRTGLIMRQIMPLAFYFSVNDVLSEQERKKYKYSTLNISGVYYKNNTPIKFYKFDDNYEYLSTPTLVSNRLTGNQETIYNYDNILEFSDTLSISTNNVNEYKYSNKIKKFYNRWMLKYSTVDNPYITNTNYNFSKAQNLQNMYYQYPQNYYWGSVLCNVVNNDINVLLPIGSNIYNHYEEYDYLVNKYFLSLNNYVTNWFDMTEKTDIDYIINNTNWANVHNDGKILYKGILYDFNKIYNKLEPADNIKIDKFAILYHVDDSELFDNTTIKNYILSDASLTYLGNTGLANVSSSLLKDNKMLYNTYNGENNYKYELNQYFTYNSYGTGKYVNIEDLGIDYYDCNKYYRISDNVISVLYEHIYNISNNNTPESNIYKGTFLLYNNIIESYEILEIPYVSNISDIIYTINESEYSKYIYFSTNNHNIITPIKNFDMKSIDDNDKDDFYKYVFYIKGHFINSKIYDDYIKNDDNGFNCLFKSQDKHNEIQDILKSGIDGVKQDNKFIPFDYIYYPYFELVTNKMLYNIFVYASKYNRFYGNDTSIKNLSYDKDILYVDTHNMDVLSYYNILNGNMYIKHISNNYITISDIVSNQDVNLVVNSEQNKQILLKELESTYTYIGYFNNNKYNVDKLITTINAIYLYKQDYKENDFGFTAYSMHYDYSNSYYTTNYDSYNTYSDTKVITAYTYNVKLNDNLLTDTITTVNNIYKNNTSVTLNAYSYCVDYKNYQIKLKNYTGYTFTLQCDNLENTYTIANKCGVSTYMKLMSGEYAYVHNHNMMGTYYYTYSYMFKHPRQLIRGIHNLSYINSTFDIDSDNIIYVSKNSNIELVTYTSNNKDCTITNPSINEKELKLDTFWSFINDNGNNELDNTSYYLVKVKNIDFLEIYLKYFVTNYKEAIKYIYIRERVFIYDVNDLASNVILTSAHNHMPDLFNQITNISNGKNIIDIIKYIDDYIFEINNKIVEIYIKRPCVPVSDILLNKIIGLNTDNYKDMYIYRLEKDNDLSDDINFNIIDKTTAKYYNSYYHNNNILMPFFDDVYEQNEMDTVLYKSYIINNISEAVFKRENVTSLKYYRYSMPDRIMMYDVSNTYTPYDSKPSIVYNTENNKVSYSYEYIDNGSCITVYDPEREVYENGYTYISTNIPTYDKHIIKESEFVQTTNTYSYIYNNYKLNTYTYNGETFGFYLININLSNINSTFNISFDDMTETKYFTRINGVSILNNHKYLTSMFKHIVPFMKYNILNKLYDIPLLNSQFKTVFNKRYKNTFEYKNGINIKHISLDETINNTISLYRYYDNIVPIIYHTSTLDTDYILKTTQEKNMLLPQTDNVPYYNQLTNIYNYPGIRNYYINEIGELDYNIISQLEYKYYNDNRFINLEPEIKIHISDNLAISDIKTFEDESVIIKYFADYVNNFKKVKFNNNEILFLYNKYSVILLSNSVKLTNDYTEKLYTLTYKFTLN